MVAAPKMTAALGFKTGVWKRGVPSTLERSVVKGPFPITTRPGAVLMAPSTGPAAANCQIGVDRSLGSKAETLPGTWRPLISVPAPATERVWPSKAVGAALPFPLVGSVRLADA